MEGAAYSFDKPYSYRIPEGMALLPGQRVRVSFGRANAKRTALVLNTGEAAEAAKLKPVLEVLDPEPVLGEEGLGLLHYLKEHTLCTFFDALRLLVPAGLGVVWRTLYAAGNLPPGRFLTPEESAVVDYLRGRKAPVESSRLQKRFGIAAPALEELGSLGVLLRVEDRVQAVRDERVVMVRRREDWAGELSPKQKSCAAFLAENEPVSLKELCYYAACTRAVPDAMEKKGALEYFDQPVLRDPFAGAGAGERAPEPDLSPQQQAAFESLRSMMGEESPRPALLHGVTGSGKTQVYLRLIRHALDRGRQALVLVPEISLTAQAVSEFHSRFGDRVAVLHSGLSLGERSDQWKRIREGGADIVVGTRSAVFAPLDRIGLIVLDEEQEHTYKSEQNPRFHAREVALVRGRYHGALVLLASATPSVESYHSAREGRYRLVELTDRFGPAELPDVFTVDLGDAANAGPTPWLSRVLLEELGKNLAAGEQSILLLNRRGYSTLVRCSSCGTVADCPNCSVALTYHQANGSLICHYCGHRQPLIRACGHCGSELVRYAGTGTQKMEEELSLHLPGARVLRVDMDTTMSKFSHQKLFGAFGRREYDIMIGTQMVAKGLNFPAVTLVGVLSADQAIYGGDFRSFERAFSLLTQVVGRGGRGDARGRAIVQTYSPDHPVIELAARQDYPAFWRDEILSRRLHLYPPYCTMAGIGFVGEEPGAVLRACKAFAGRFRETAERDYPDLPARLLGPAPSDIPKAAGRYRYKLVLKCRADARLRGLLAGLLGWFGGEFKEVHAFVDMHYDRL